MAKLLGGEAFNPLDGHAAGERTEELLKKERTTETPAIDPDPVVDKVPTAEKSVAAETARVEGMAEVKKNLGIEEKPLPLAEQEAVIKEITAGAGEQAAGGSEKIDHKDLFRRSEIKNLEVGEITSAANKIDIRESQWINNPTGPSEKMFVARIGNNEYRAGKTEEEALSPNALKVAVIKDFTRDKTSYVAIEDSTAKPGEKLAGAAASEAGKEVNKPKVGKKKGFLSSVLSLWK